MHTFTADMQMSKIESVVNINTAAQCMYVCMSVCTQYEVMYKGTTLKHNYNNAVIRGFHCIINQYNAIQGNINYCSPALLPGPPSLTYW